MLSLHPEDFQEPPPRLWSMLDARAPTSYLDLTIFESFGKKLNLEYINVSVSTELFIKVWVTVVLLHGHACPGTLHTLTPARS